MSLFRFCAAAAIVALITAVPAGAKQSRAVVNLEPLYSSGETGTATLSEVPGGVRVVVALSNAPSGVLQPAHIHIGTCSKNTATQWVLANLLDGKSTTVLRGISFADLTSGKYLINVHESTDDLKDYVACGVIPK